MTYYVIHPGMVKSTYDGEYHWIGFAQLVGLYGLSRDQCLNANTMTNADRLGEIHLYPREDGNYTLGE